MTPETKPLELLVIEDTPAFIDVARSVFSADTSVNVSYASTYEEAIFLLQSRQIDAVITDLFFPSQIRWTERFYEGMKEEMTKERDLLAEKLAEKQIKYAKEPSIRLEQDIRWLQRTHAEHATLSYENPTEGSGRTLRDFQDLSENPSGLGIAEHCMMQRIPFLILTQGDRHFGNLGIIRNALHYAAAFTHEYERDPLPNMGYNSCLKTNKSEQSTWQGAAKEVMKRREVRKKT